MRQVWRAYMNGLAFLPEKGFNLPCRWLRSRGTTSLCDHAGMGWRGETSRGGSKGTGEQSDVGA